MDWEECKGLTDSFLAMGQCSWQRALARVQVNSGSRQLFYCQRCGGIAEYYAKFLAVPECRPATAQQQRNLRRIAMGMHPNGIDRVGTPQRLTNRYDVSVTTRQLESHYEALNGYGAHRPHAPAQRGVLSV